MPREKFQGVKCLIFTFKITKTLKISKILAFLQNFALISGCERCEKRALGTPLFVNNKFSRFLKRTFCTCRQSSCDTFELSRSQIESFASIDIGFYTCFQKPRLRDFWSKWNPEMSIVDTFKKSMPEAPSHLASKASASHHVSRTYQKITSSQNDVLHAETSVL